MVCAGLNALVAAKAFGASRMAITDVRDDNLGLAEAYGAKHALLTPPSMGNEEAAALLKGWVFVPNIVCTCLWGKYFSIIEALNWNLRKGMSWPIRMEAQGRTVSIVLSCSSNH